MIYAGVAMQAAGVLLLAAASAVAGVDGGYILMCFGLVAVGNLMQG